MRLFAAIPLPFDIRERLSSLCASVQGARWLPMEQMHLTLRFIGEVNGTTGQDIINALRDVSFSTFNLHLRGVGCFRKGRAPKVIWAGVDDRIPLERLHGKIEAVLQRVGVTPEKRKFWPHVTLARLKGAHMTKVADFLGNHALFETQPFSVGGFNLFSSQLGAAGALHTVEAAYNFTDVGSANAESWLPAE